MIKVNLICRNIEDFEEAKKNLEKFGFEYCDENPELVIAHGGDGTLLRAERRFPSVPKILIKSSKTCKRCCELGIEDALKSYVAGNYKTRDINKIKATALTSAGAQEIIGMNDIVLRNTLPTEAIRFELFVNDEDIGEFIGDGVVIATPYGSTAYFNSITRKSFESGIGIAFNNINYHKEPMILNPGDKIKLKLLRGPAVLVADNNRDFVNLEHGDEIEVIQSDEKARAIVF